MLTALSTIRCFAEGRCTRYCVQSHKFLLIPMHSQGIPLFIGSEARGAKTPPPRAGIIQAPTFRNDEIRRAGEQTSPQVARAVGPTRKRDEGGGLSNGSSSIRRFHLKDRVPMAGVRKSNGNRAWGLKKGPRGLGSEVQRRIPPEGGWKGARVDPCFVPSCS